MKRVKDVMEELAIRSAAKTFVYAGVGILAFSASIWNALRSGIAWGLKSEAENSKSDQTDQNATKETADD